MNFQIRTFKPDDAPAFIAAQNEAAPSHPLSLGEFERDLERLEEHLQYHLLVAESDGEIVGGASFYRNPGQYHPHKFQLQLFVRPAFQSQSIGRALYDRVLEELRPLEPISLATQVRENEPNAVRFAVNRGFEEVKRDFESILETATFDGSVYDGLISRLKAEGITFKTFRELDTPEFRHAFHDVFEVVRQDVPRSEPTTPLTFEFFNENVIDDEEMLQNMFWFALHDEKIVGFTGGYSSSKPGWMDTWLTAVTREARGRGIAQALKVLAIEAAKEAGFNNVRTDNDTRNAPMLAVNVKFGFVRQPAVLSVRKTF
jgi:mycothiol synthase